MMVKSSNRLKVVIALLTFFACVISAALIFIEQPIARADDGEREVVATYILGEDVERMYGAKAVPTGEGYYTAVRGADGKFVYTYSDFATGWSMAMRESTSVDTPVLVKLVDNWIAEETDETITEYYQEYELETSFGSDERAFWNGSLYIPEENGVVLDLNGYMLDRHRDVENGQKYGSVIYMAKNSLLEITDSYKGEIPDDEENERVHNVTGREATGDKDSYRADIFEIKTCTVKGGLITGGFSDYGGGIYAPNGGTIILSGGTIAYNGQSESYYNAYGGGVYLYGQANSPATFMMTGGEVRNNISMEGGGLYLCGTAFTMTGGAIKNNNSSAAGAGAYVNIYSTVRIDGGEISGNATGDYSDGGGLYLNSGSSFMMTDGYIINNVSGRDGGGVFSGTVTGTHIYYDEPFTITGGEISGNTARNNGGGIAVYHGTLTITGGTIKNNSISDSSAGGGGVFSGNEFIMTGGEISNNSFRAVNNGSGSGGGGVRVHGKFTMSGNAKIVNNTASGGSGGGGGVSIASTAEFTMNGGEISGNSISGSYISAAAYITKACLN